MGSAPPVRVELLGRSGCHLCDDAREVVREATEALGVRFAELDVDSDPELRAEWGDLVPVVLLDGVCHGYYRFSVDRLSAAIHARSTG